MKVRSRVLIDRRLIIGSTGRYVAQIRVLSVPKSSKFPSGIKAKFVLLDTIGGGFPRLLIDNHEPYGFHIHARLPEEPYHRERLRAQNHEEALQLFLDEAERIVRNEEK